MNNDSPNRERQHRSNESPNRERQHRSNESSSKNKQDDWQKDGRYSHFYHSRGNLFKTEMCRLYDEMGHCKFDTDCKFAHGPEELRMVFRHPRYRTKYCENYHNNAYCPYGPRCYFIHEDKTGRKSSLEGEVSGYGTSTSSDSSAISVPSTVSRVSHDTNNMILAFSNGSSYDTSSPLTISRLSGISAYDINISSTMSSLSLYDTSVSSISPRSSGKTSFSSDYSNQEEGSDIYQF
ncbi:hypothetical protein WDU94_012775 [Cyamophila willieti]